MGLDIKTLAASKKYTKDTVSGEGAIQGKPGKDGITPHIGNNGNWFIDTEDTGIKAEGENGQNGITPQVGDNGNWYIGDYNTNIKASGSNGEDGFTPIITEDSNNTDNKYRLKIQNKDCEIITPNLKGERGIQGLQGQQGEAGEQGQQGIQGIKGDKGDDGYPFLIYKEYSDLSEFNSVDFPEVGLMFMIKEDGATDFPVYRYIGEEDNQYSYITSLSGGEAIKGNKGDKGDDGEQGIPGQNGQDGTTYTPTIGTVTSVEPDKDATASVTIDDENKTAQFSFGIPKGEKGLQGIPGKDGTDGTDGITPTINEENKHWMIGDIDTGVITEGKDGRSIQSIGTNDNEEIIVIYSDGTTQNIGKLSVDISADFLTSNGFGNLRYYNGHFQYYDTNIAEWVDTSITSDNVYIFNMMPQSMQHICGIYDVEKSHYKMMFEEPADTVIDGQVACVVEKVVIRRKLGSDPQNENDGTLVTIIMRPDFGKYKNNWYVDNSFTPNMGEEWHYKAFPISTTGFVNAQSDNSTGGILAKNYYLFEFQIDTNESDPDVMVSYASDNAKFKIAYMDYALDKFNYGSWEDAFFMPKPCMLNIDGTVAYYLNPNNYELKTDGTPSDIANSDFEGNAMMEFPKIYWKKSGDSGYAIASKKVDDSFKCWSNLDANGNEIDHFYMSIYDGSLINSKLRSLSGQVPMCNTTRQQEIDYANANNLNGTHIYDTIVFCDVQLFRLLCILISGTTNSKKAFGNGNSNTYVNTSNTGLKQSGTMNDKGMFWGNQDNMSGVKVFGMENTWGNIYKSCAGWIYDRGIQKIKMTYSQSDGSTVDGYNTTGVGYIAITDSTLSGTNGGFVSVCKFEEYGFVPKQIGASATTKYCDGLWYDNNQINYAFIGGTTTDKFHVGAFLSYLSLTPTFKAWCDGASISCKPLAKMGGES